MMRMFLVAAMLMVALGGGLVGGWWLRPDLPTEAKATPATHGDHEYLRLTDQFVVPILAGGRVEALMVLTLGLEVVAGQSDAVLAAEPRLRDEFLQLLFDHANSGGFRGAFTDAARLVGLRGALLEASRQAIGPGRITDVLITDLMRQDR